MGVRQKIFAKVRDQIMPLVSVVLSVNNGGADLPIAVDSILAQTFTDFELIAINNGSTDKTAAVLDGLRDPRVRVVHQDDVGLPPRSTAESALARGRHIARQNHDDWAKLTRLAKQVAFMEANPIVRWRGRGLRFG